MTGLNRWRESFSSGFIYVGLARVMAFIRMWIISMMENIDLMGSELEDNFV